MGKFQDLSGEKFGKLKVLSYLGKSKWHCICDCGKYYDVVAYSLKSGNTKSCGCYNVEMAKTTNTTHSKSKTKMYGVWCAMKRRCYNKNDKSYKHYGGRGIIVCDEWKNDFQSFYDWATLNGYKENLTIDRIDVNGNYEPNNCRWVDYKTQARNKTNNHLIDIKENKKITLIEFSEKYNINYNTLLTNINRNKDIFNLIKEN